MQQPFFHITNRRPRRGGGPHGRPDALSELSPIRFEFSFASLAVKIIRLRLRRHRRHHTTLREIFFRTPIGLGAPESITVKSTARDAPRRSAGQSLRRSRRAATLRLRLCGGCRTLAWIPSSFVASISRRSAGGSSVRSGISQGNQAISSLAPFDFCASMILRQFVAALFRMPGTSRGTRAYARPGHAAPRRWVPQYVNRGESNIAFCPISDKENT
jgi:hypothetical protein